MENQLATKETNKVSILISDDDDFIRDILSQALVRQNFNVIMCKTVKETLKEIFQNPPDVAFLDVVMPDGTAADIITVCKEKKLPTKFITMSGGGFTNQNDYMYKMKKIGSDEILPKPFTIDTVVQIVNSVIE